MFFAFLGWVLVGLVVGFIASRIVNLRGDDPLVGIAIAVGAAVPAGVIFALVSGRGIVAWDVWSLVTAAIAATVAVAIYHIIRSRSISRTRQSVRRSY